MANLLSRRSGPAALVSVLLAGLVIGCGGGGGGGGTSGSTNSGTTNSGTTNSGTTASTPGGTSGDVGTGNLPQDSIFYAVSSGAGTNTYDVRYIKEDGTGFGAYATAVSAAASPASPNPQVPGQFVFAAKPTGSSTYGLYKGTVASTTDSNTTQILAPSLAQITTLQVSRDGTKAIYIGSSSSSVSAVLSLYVISTSGGAPTTIEADVDTASLSADGTKVVYSKFPDGENDTELYVRFLSETASTRLTNNSLFDDDPQFSKDGTKVVFSESVSTSSNRQQLATINLASGAPFAITTFDPVPTSDLQRAPSFNSAGTRVSFVVVSGVSGAGGVWTSNVDGSDARQIVASDLLLPGTYWSTPAGRSLGGEPFGLSLGRKR